MSTSTTSTPVAPASTSSARPRPTAAAVASGSGPASVGGRVEIYGGSGAYASTMRIASSSRGYLPPFLVCLCFLQRCYGASHHHPPAKVPSRNGTRAAPGQTEVHHRPKRGWIWNQFFVLEEHMGPDSQYVGKVRKRFFGILFAFGILFPSILLGK